MSWTLRFVVSSLSSLDATVTLALELAVAANKSELAAADVDGAEGAAFTAVGSSGAAVWGVSTMGGRYTLGKARCTSSGTALRGRGVPILIVAQHNAQ